MCLPFVWTGNCLLYRRFRSKATSKGLASRTTVCLHWLAETGVSYLKSARKTNLICGAAAGEGVDDFRPVPRRKMSASMERKTPPEWLLRGLHLRHSREATLRGNIRYAATSGHGIIDHSGRTPWAHACHACRYFHNTETILTKRIKNSATWDTG